MTYRFATVDLTSPFAPAPLATVALVLAGKALGWPNRIVATAVGNRRFAIVVGGASGQGRLAVVEVTDPLNPVVQAIVDLEGLGQERYPYPLNLTRRAPWRAGESDALRLQSPRPRR